MVEHAPLTPRQSEIYEFIVERITNGLPPTVREVGSQFKIRSPNGVMCHLKALERKGLITRESHQSRAIMLVDNPQVTLRAKCKTLVNRWSRKKDITAVMEEIKQLIK